MKPRTPVKRISEKKLASVYSEALSQLIHIGTRIVPADSVEVPMRHPSAQPWIIEGLAEAGTNEKLIPALSPSPTIPPIVVQLGAPSGGVRERRAARRCPGAGFAGAG